MGRIIENFLVLAISCSLLGGCETVKKFFADDEVPFDPSVNPTWFDGQPRIRSGVILEVQVSAAGDKPSVVQCQVDNSGKATIPYMLTEPVQCDGLTLEAFREKLTKKYTRFIRQPQVTVRFGPFDERNGVSPYGTVNVLGEVGNPGPVNMPATMDLTVTKALMAAGGLRQFADKRKIRVSRCDKDGKITSKIVDVIKIGEEGRIDLDMLLRPGDVVYAHERYW